MIKSVHLILETLKYQVSLRLLKFPYLVLMLVLIILKGPADIMTVLPLMEHMRHQVKHVIPFDNRLLPLYRDSRFFDLRWVVRLIPLYEV